MKILVTLIVLATSLSAFSQTYKCTFNHTDVDTLGVTEIDHEFTLAVGEDKVINFPKASRKVLVARLEVMDNPYFKYSLGASIFRSYDAKGEGEISYEQAKITNTNLLMYSVIAFENLSNRMQLIHSGAHHELNSDFSLFCEKM